MMRYQVATVYSVEEKGLRLLLPGEESPTTKAYPHSKGLSFSAGDQVLLLGEGDSAVVAFVIE